MGALKGAPCTVKTTEVTEAGLKVIFEWQDEGGTSHTTETIIPAGPQGQQGLPGTPVAPMYTRLCALPAAPTRALL